MKFTRKQEPNPCRGEGADKTFGAQGTYIYEGRNCSTEEDVPWRRLCIHGRYVESEAFERQSSSLGAYFLGKWCSSVEKMIKNTVALLIFKLF